VPKIYRTMKRDGARPLVGIGSNELGARVPTDIAPDTQGMVRPATGGISVSPSLHTLPAHLVPARLGDRRPDARGKDSLAVWSMGSGSFAAGQVAPDLGLRIDRHKATHGFVEPIQPTKLADYQESLARTKNDWSIDET
jgi:hypothetical protein